MLHLWEKMRRHPAFQSIAEVMIAVIFTFLPIILASIPLKTSSGALTKNDMFGAFLSFWEAGQLSLPIFGVSGAIATLVVLNKSSFGGVSMFFATIVSLGCTAIAGFILAGSEGFSSKLYPEIMWAGFGMYGAMLGTWFVLSLIVRTDSGEIADPEKRANNLLERQDQYRKGLNS